ncbi:transposase [Burkholderia pseudomallei]|nr:transposase [Burkholderia pseudomallei]
MVFNKHRRTIEDRVTPCLRLDAAWGAAPADLKCKPLH